MRVQGYDYSFFLATDEKNAFPEMKRILKCPVTQNEVIQREKETHQ